MSTELFIKNSCANILNNVRQSGLNFAIQETPYSFYVTVRKSPLKSPSTIRFTPDPQLSAMNLESTGMIEKLRSSCDFLKQSNDNLKLELADTVDEIEAKTETLSALQSETKILREKLTESKEQIDEIVGNKTKHINEEKKALQAKHEQVCSEKKFIKSELESAKKVLNSADVALKGAKKINLARKLINWNPKLKNWRSSEGQNFQKKKN